MNFKEIPVGYVFRNDDKEYFGFYKKISETSMIALDNVFFGLGLIVEIDDDYFVDGNLNLIDEDDYKSMLERWEESCCHMREATNFKPLEVFVPGHLYEFPGNVKKICSDVSEMDITFFSKNGRELYSKSVLKTMKIKEIVDKDLTDKLKEIF